MSYTQPHKYTAKELDDMAIADAESDARQSEFQAQNGPFWPEKGITAESCAAYAAKCRRWIEKYKNGGAHKAAMRGDMEA